MTVVITAANLRAIAPVADASIIDGIVANQGLLERYGINTGPLAARRVEHFLGHSAVETQGFTRLEENLYYTTTRRLMQVWPSRFRSSTAAAPYVRNPEKLANNVYANRLGNGSSASGDGWRYRGSGCKQTTGRSNFRAAGHERDPEALRRFPEALESACIYWRDNNLVRYADADDTVGLTRRIQGGTGGLADRRVYTARAKKVKWGEESVRPIPPAKDGQPLLRRGDGVTRNLALRPVIMTAQRRLALHGFDPGHIDGKFGDGTENAVVAFQKAHGLLADGVIGSDQTWPALIQAPPAIGVDGLTDTVDLEETPKPAEGAGKGTAAAVGVGAAGVVAGGGALAADDGTFTWILVGLIVVVVAAVGVLIWRARRRK